MADLPHVIHLGHHPDTRAPLGWDYVLEPNLMLTGGAGMGKTYTMRSILKQAVVDVAWYKAHGRRASVKILDPKGGLGYREFETVAQIVKADWQLSTGYAVWMAFFAGLWKEYEYRMNLVAKVNAGDFSVDEWQGAGLGPMFVVLEEIQALFSAMVKDVDEVSVGKWKNVGKAHIEECQNELTAAASLFRGAGIRLIVISQAAHDVYIPVRAKLSMPAKLCMGTTIGTGQFMAAFGDSMPPDFVYHGGRGKGLALLNGYLDPIVIE